MKRLVLVFIVSLLLSACAAQPAAVISPFIMPLPASRVQPSVTPLPTIEPPTTFVRPAVSPTPTGFIILSGPTLDPETLAAFNVIVASPTPTAQVALISPTVTPTQVVALSSPTARAVTITPTAQVAAISPTAAPTQVAALSSPTARAVTATPTQVVVLASPTTRPPTATPTAQVAAIPPTLPPTTTPLPAVTPTRVAIIPPTATVPASWQFQQGNITAPVLLYHRIQAPPDPAKQSPRYSVPPETFEEQLKAFKEWGYTSITISQLSNAIKNGAPLPPRPIIFTFDDGYISVYNNAFPLMKKYGFVGVFYILGQNFSDPDFVNADQLREMAAAGWEIGSHSMTHSHLPQNYDSLNLEVVESKKRLETLIGVPILSFAYPFGEFDEKVVNKVAAYYTSAVALGPFYENGPGHLYAIRRIEIRYEYTIDDIAKSLPWSSPP